MLCASIKYKDVYINLFLIVFLKCILERQKIPNIIQYHIFSISFVLLALVTAISHCNVTYLYVFCMCYLYVFCMIVK